MTRPFDVAVVGLGPTGATLANLCGRRGLRTVVYEQSAAPYPLPRACHLDAEIARVFQGLGFADELADVLTVSAGMEYVDAAGRRLFTYEGFEREPLLGWYEDYVFVQPEIDMMLRRGIERYPCVDVRLGMPAPPIVELLAAATFVVAADGATSDIRRSLGIELVDLGFDEDWLVIDVMVDELGEPALPTIIQQVCDPDRAATFVPSHGRHRRWEFRIEPGEAPDPWALLAGWGIGPDSAELVRAVPYRFHAVVADRWRAGPDDRVLLAGDAAHQMPPFMGQGMCSGVRDAVNLAWKLAEVVGGVSSRSLLDTYEAERRPHTEAVIQLSVDAGRLLRDLTAAVRDDRPFTMPDPDAPDARRWSRLPGLDLGGPFPIGHQLPQPDRLDDRLGDGWSVVCDERGQVPAPPGVTVVVEPRATFGERAVLVRPDRYIAAVLGEAGIGR
ncbi:MAG: bifunctional 3-(3-hydroxy-phenyl)propionate/3-hydroxycinnamic acid hydroxylase [Acidimicrobiia bacterium]